MMQKRPVAGFWGNIDDSINVNLVEFLANRCREWTFVFFGDIACDVTKLNKYKNIHFVSQQVYNSHPEAAKALDVWLLPFQLKNKTITPNMKRNVDFQLNTSKPLILYPEIEIRHENHELYVAHDYDEFKDHLSRVYILKTAIN